MTKGKKTSQKKSSARALKAKRRGSHHASKRESARSSPSLGKGSRGVEEQAVSSGLGEGGRLLSRPTFVPCTLTGPDGTIRQGWEMWIGGHLFGRADSKKLLLASYARLQSPPSSFHWREIRKQRRRWVEAQEEWEGFQEWEPEEEVGEVDREEEAP